MKTLLMCVINVLSQYKINSDEYIWNMTGGVYEGVLHPAGMWGYFRRKRLWNHCSVTRSPLTTSVTCSLTGEALLITLEHLHLFFTPPPSDHDSSHIKLRKSTRDNSFRLDLRSWVSSSESVTARFGILGGFSTLVFICRLPGWALPWKRDRLPLSLYGTGWINGLTDF